MITRTSRPENKIQDWTELTNENEKTIIYYVFIPVVNTQ